jgi:hypothetical protein
LPPFGTKIDLASSGIHVGSRAVREMIEKKRPVLHFCGHCHEGFGEEKLGETISINVAAVKEGRALLVDLEEMEWERIRF